MPDEDLHPGPDLDARVAEALGIVPCTGWRAVSLGAAGGPALQAVGCYHARGACYPSVTHAGVGGLPPFSSPEGRQHHKAVTLADLPFRSLLYRDADETYYVYLEAAHTTVAGMSEPHALSLAVLTAARFGVLAPRFTEATRWNPRWREVPAKWIPRWTGGTDVYPLLADGAPPWTPRVLLALDDLLQQVEARAKHDEAVALNRTAPRDRQVLYGDHRPHGGDQAVILAFLSESGVSQDIVRRLRAEADARGVEAANREFQARMNRSTR